MASRNLGTIDLDTGELLEGTPVWVGRKPKIHDRWFMAFQDAFLELARDKDLTGETTRVLHYLMGRLDFENFIQVAQQEIATELDMRKQHVSRSVKILVEKQVLIRGPKIGRSYSFRLNPHYGWKGKVRNLDQAKRKRLEVVDGGKP